MERVASSQVGAAFGTYYIPAWPLNESKNMTPESDWAEINLANLDGKSNPAINQVSIQHFNVVTKDAPENAEEALIKLLNLSLVDVYKRQLYAVGMAVAIRLGNNAFAEVRRTYETVSYTHLQHPAHRAE